MDTIFTILYFLCIMIFYFFYFFYFYDVFFFLLLFFFVQSFPPETSAARSASPIFTMSVVNGSSANIVVHIGGFRDSSSL